MKHSLFSAVVPFFLALPGVAVAAGLTDSSLETHVDSCALGHSFVPVKSSYWTGYPHHRRTNFALSPSGTTAYLAYLDASGTGVHVQPVDPTTFAATGTEFTIAGGMEAGGLVAQDDGFALLTNEVLPSGTSGAPSGSTPVAVLYRFDASGNQKWKTWLGGPNVPGSESGNVASPDLNGDLVYSKASGQYAAYFVITAYTGGASGHFGDAIRYVDDNGKIVVIQGASSEWGCSHNTGIAFEAADKAPYASVCAEDQGAIWLNTRGQGMGTDGVKVSNENTTNGGSGEPFGGMSGSYSNLARFANSDGYILAWVSRGAVHLTLNDWMGAGYTHSQPRTSNRNVAIAIMKDKNTLNGQEATSQVGAESGDSQINWVTQGSADCSNAHAAVFDGTNALVTWEEIANPTCDFVAMGCRGAFTGSYFQLVDSSGAKIGTPVKSLDTYVAGDMVTMGDGRICWPYANMKWTLDGPVEDGSSGPKVSKMSFACMNLDGKTPPPSTSKVTTTTSTEKTTTATSAEMTTATSVEGTTTRTRTPTTSSPLKPSTGTVSSGATAATSSTSSSVDIGSATYPSTLITSTLAATSPPTTSTTTSTTTTTDQYQYPWGGGGWGSWPTDWSQWGGKKSRKGKKGGTTPPCPEETET